MPLKPLIVCTMNNYLKSCTVEELRSVLEGFLACWYVHQSMRVKWAHVISALFGVRTAVRLGCILHLLLFSKQTGELAKLLSRCFSGCVAGNVFINLTLYADDVVIFSPYTAVTARLPAIWIRLEYYSARKSPVIISLCKVDSKLSFPDLCVSVARVCSGVNVCY